MENSLLPENQLILLCLRQAIWLQNHLLLSESLSTQAVPCKNLMPQPSKEHLVFQITQLILKIVDVGDHR